MTPITGYHHLGLNVTDLQTSIKWYSKVLGFSLETEFEKDGFRRARLRHPRSGIALSLTRHERGSGEPFSELRTGMDHVAFAVPGQDDLAALKRRLEELGVEHSDIKPQPRKPGERALITLRDPDNIQLEVFAVESQTPAQQKE